MRAILDDAALVHDENAIALEKKAEEAVARIIGNGEAATAETKSENKKSFDL
jgi:hypothetical protein